MSIKGRLMLIKVKITEKIFHQASAPKIQSIPLIIRNSFDLQDYFSNRDSILLNLYHLYNFHSI